MIRIPPVAILVPVLKRPDNVAPLIESVREGTRSTFHVRTSWTLLFIADENDMPEREELRKHVDFRDGTTVRYITVTEPYPGSYARKINAGFVNSNTPLLFSAADDVRFHRGWLFHAWSMIGGRTHVVGTNDLGNPRTRNGVHSTHTLFTRHYIDHVGGVIDQEPGIVLNEDYPHSWVDDEFIGTARFRKAYAHAPDSHVEHLHWLWGKGHKDETYEIGNQGHRRGMQLYRDRQHLWEGTDRRVMSPRERKQYRENA